ncbi:hypothetical protein TNCV_1844091 [Trichonephila clavipes]|nr:hypothetical protein TNCV_1844091 [Trichonephila clavipes]
MDFSARNKVAAVASWSERHEFKSESRESLAVYKDNALEICPGSKSSYWRDVEVRERGTSSGVVLVS